MIVGVILPADAEGCNAGLGAERVSEFQRLAALEVRKRELHVCFEICVGYKGIVGHASECWGWLVWEAPFQVIRNSLHNTLLSPGGDVQGSRWYLRPRVSGFVQQCRRLGRAIQRNILASNIRREFLPRGQEGRAPHSIGSFRQRGPKRGENLRFR